MSTKSEKLEQIGTRMAEINDRLIALDANADLLVKIGEAGASGKLNTVNAVIDMLEEEAKSIRKELLSSREEMGNLIKESRKLL